MLLSSTPSFLLVSLIFASCSSSSLAFRPLPSLTSSSAFATPRSAHLPLSSASASQNNQYQRRKQAALQMSLDQYAGAAISLFNNIRTPGAVVPAGIASPLPPVDENEGTVATVLRKIFPLVVLYALTSCIVTVTWSSVIVNQLTETQVAKAQSVWHLLVRDYELAWAGVNTHFFTGLLGFMFMVGTRIYLMVCQGSSGKWVGGLVASAICSMISVINRGVANGNGQGLSYGSNVLALIGRYTQLLIQRAFNPKTFGPLEVSAFVLFVVSILGASFSIWSDLRGKTKEE